MQLTGRIKEFAKRWLVSSVRFLSPSSLSIPSSLDVEPLKPARGSGGVVSMWSGVEPRPNVNLVHFKAVRKPLVAISLYILSTMFYSRTIKIYH